jgi:hypothetical protein
MAASAARRRWRKRVGHGVAHGIALSRPLPHAGLVFARLRLVLAPLAIAHALASPGVLAAEPRLPEGKPAEAKPPDDMTYGDNIAACRAMARASDKEVAAFRASQPQQPIPDPRPDTVLGAPGWADGVKGFGRVPVELWLATFLPHFGVVARSDAPAFVVAWPWSFPVGPAFTCSKHQGALFVSTHAPFRVVLEPGMIYGDRLFVFHLRHGARFIHQQSDWVVGVGGGIGSTIDLVSRQEGVRASISPEVVLRLGKCCDPGYFMLAGRVDVFFTGATLVQPMVHLGFTYF